MKSLCTAGMILASALLMCSVEALVYDIKTSELINGEEVNIQENEVFIEESYVTPEPPVIYMNEPEDKNSELESDEDAFVGRETYNLTALQIAMAFGKHEPHIPEEHMNFQFGFGVESQGNAGWSEWTCCRRVVNIKSRKRTNGPRIELEYSKCWDQYCAAHECEDVKFICQQFTSQFGVAVCNPSHGMSTFMSHHCPQTCNFCSWSSGTRRPTRAPATTRPWWHTQTTTGATRRPFTTTRPIRTTPRPRPVPTNRNIVQVTILSHNLNPPSPTYKFVSSNQRTTGPWRRIPSRGAELSSLYLYARPTGNFKLRLNFCSAKDGKTGLKKYIVKKGNCVKAWSTEFTLYASKYRSKDAKIYYVGNRLKPFSSKISRSFPIPGFKKGAFYFYGPDPNAIRTTQRPTTHPRVTRRPTLPPFTRQTTQRPTLPPFTRQTTRRPFPQTTRPTRPGPQPTNTFNKECLDMHNLYRAVHNVPALQWSPELARTAQAWAQQLKQIAPERPNRLVQPNRRTRNWPHSDSGVYRNRGDGENIAWDLSDDGSPAKESVMRWYAELFYYDRRNPTRAPSSDKPIGHLTQLLWKDTTHLGCGAGKTTVPMQGYTLISTWTVSHYSPGGNIRYPTHQANLNLYNKQVPDMRSGSCLTKSGTCNNGNQCMAFGGPNGQRSTCSCARSRPMCRGRYGCLAVCENRTGTWPWKSECQGQTECSCGAKGAVCK